MKGPTETNVKNLARPRNAHRQCLTRIEKEEREDFKKRESFHTSRTGKDKKVTLKMER